jgi:hypothetical protein
MQITKAVVNDVGEYAHFSVNVCDREGERELWFRVPSEFGSMLSERSDGPLAGLLFRAMILGEDIHIDGEVSETLYYNLSRPCQRLLKEIYPELSLVNIFPEKIVPDGERANGVATGFSSGIDSFTVLADHHYSDHVPEGYRITHLLFNNVGSHGAGGERLFYERFSRVKEAAGKIGLPIIPVNSNMDEFYVKLGYEFVNTHTPRNVAVGHILQNGIDKLLYASTYDFGSVSVKATVGGFSRCEPLILPLLSSSTMQAIQTGSEYSRFEKTAKVSRLEDSYSLLDVCVKAQDAQKAGTVNCSTCRKCMRTLLAMEILGMQDCYGDLFRIDLYQKNRQRFIAELYQSEDPNEYELIDYALRHGYQLPMRAQFLGKTGFVKLYVLADLYKKFEWRVKAAAERVRRFIPAREAGTTG